MYTKNEAITKARLNNKDSRIAREHIASWEQSLDTELYHVYKSYSVYKEQAMQRCRAMMLAYDGHFLRILSHNSETFTVGFEFYDDETGELMFAYITKDYDRFCIMD